MIASTSTVTSSLGHAMPGPSAMAIACLLSWLVTEAFGAWMLRRWIRAGGARRPAARGELRTAPVVFGHAGLALSGLTSWIIFLATSSAAAAWLAIGLLAPAIGLGVSTLTTWTPYPVVPPPGPASPDQGWPVPQEEAALRRALASEALTGELIDDLLARMLAEPVQPPRPRWRLAPLVPVVHGAGAIATFLLAVLAAIGASG